MTNTHEPIPCKEQRTPYSGSQLLHEQLLTAVNTDERMMQACPKKIYLEGNVFEGRLGLEDAILDPPLRLEVSSIRAPNIWHSSHAVRMKYNSISFPHYLATRQNVVCNSLFRVLYQVTPLYYYPVLQYPHFY